MTKNVFTPFSGVNENVTVPLKFVSESDLFIHITAMFFRLFPS